MASLSDTKKDTIRLLDPGAGTGVLTAAWVAEICNRKNRPSRICVTAFETDSELIPGLYQALEACRSHCKDAGIDFTHDLIEADFIDEAVERLDTRPLLSSSDAPFDCVVVNPPYRKLNRESETRKNLSRIGIETSNLYAAFLWLSFRLLDENGELIAITPRSFCNGPYFRLFRVAFLRAMTIRRLHVYGSRTSAFKDSGVLQENVIFSAVKSQCSMPAIVSSSSDPDEEDVCFRETAQNQLVDADNVIHIVPDEFGNRFAERVRSLPDTLQSLGIQVSTGRVVDFRFTKSLMREANGRTVPLIYPAHFENGYITWPKDGKKPNYLRVDSDTRPLLVPRGTYVLVKRFSAKEEKRRVMAAVCDPQRLPASDFGFENHLNYFHKSGSGLPTDVAKGISAYLNSSLLDSYFRNFSGHTQVNASDLRALRYPDIETLKRIGEKLGDRYPDHESLDELVYGELKMAGEDPNRAKVQIANALTIIKALGIPKGQHNERSALTLLALLDLKPSDKWSAATSPMMGIRPMMDWFADYYGKKYAENTRESVRRYTIHQFLEAGIVIKNPDVPTRPPNSMHYVYQIEPNTLKMLRTYGTARWDKNLREWLSTVETLNKRYARERKMAQIPLVLSAGESISLSPGGQNELVKKIVEEFCPRFTPGGIPIYIGDTAAKWAYFKEDRLNALGVTIDSHGKMPDLVIHYTDMNWLVLIEAVSSHGPVDSKRRDELYRLFENSTAGLVFVTAFLDRRTMVKYLNAISWETEVWVADAPSHMIHFNGERFLGPY
jgi:adenine-specific DNA-methyltransferase